MKRKSMKKDEGPRNLKLSRGPCCPWLGATVRVLAVTPLRLASTAHVTGQGSLNAPRPYGSEVTATPTTAGTYNLKIEVTSFDGSKHKQTTRSLSVGSDPKSGRHDPQYPTAEVGYLVPLATKSSPSALNEPSCSKTRSPSSISRHRLALSASDSLSMIRSSSTAPSC